ncbi:macro domain-containing protein [Holdemanella porci]|uniref:macro domain-containing protein n=1 Tax=Holdemanella porci TaxID=2652276 RepID=UPI002FDD8A77
MPLKIIRQNITKLKVDAIVNATNPSFDATGGLDHYIHQQAGNELDENCRKLRGNINKCGWKLIKLNKFRLSYLIRQFYFFV